MGRTSLLEARLTQILRSIFECVIVFFSFCRADRNNPNQRFMFIDDVDNVYGTYSENLGIRGDEHEKSSCFVQSVELALCRRSKLIVRQMRRRLLILVSLRSFV